MNLTSTGGRYFRCDYMYRTFPEILLRSPLKLSFGVLYNGHRSYLHPYEH
jgi:hypothetical protein